VRFFVLLSCKPQISTPDLEDLDYTSQVAKGRAPCAARRAGVRDDGCEEDDTYADLPEYSHTLHQVQFNRCVAYL
jgi:hypothetical protein